MKIKLTIAYDGRPYSGWGTQPNGNTIQDHVESAIEEVAKEKVRIHASGRTDAGVHAHGQVAHFDSPAHITMNPANWVPALNTKLAATIRILGCQEVSEDFHARFSAIEKTYTYALNLAPVLPPLSAGLAWHLPRQLDPDTLEQGLQIITGTHDFRAFAALRGNETEETDYVRTISKATLETTTDGYKLSFTGNGFLYKMVRLLTGTLVHTAQGRMRLDELEGLLDQAPDPPNGRASLCAPPDGLFLEKVSY